MKKQMKFNRNKKVCEKTLNPACNTLCNFPEVIFQENRYTIR